jgi:hypothetical protein
MTGIDIPRAPEHAGRPPLERVLVRTPRLFAMGMAVVARRPATSRLRRRALLEGFSRGFAAINRGDPWFIQLVYEPDCEICPASGLRTLGLAERYRGHGGWRELTDAVREPLPDLRWVPEHLIDLGGRWVVRLGMSGSGRASGVPTHQTWGSVYHLSARGLVKRQDIHWTWEETLAAEGLRG